MERISIRGELLQLQSWKVITTTKKIIAIAKLESFWESQRSINRSNLFHSIATSIFIHPIYNSKQ